MLRSLSRLRERVSDQQLITLVGILLALAGLTSYTDGIVRYVTVVVDGISWWDIHKPVFDPPPMNTYTYRPLTVVLVKLELLLSGRDPFWMTVLHLPVVPWLGLATHRFLRTHGLAHVATRSALCTMALPSMLFSGWIPVEPDSLGAAFFCEMGWALQLWRQNKSRKHLILFVLFAFGVATTKETSAAAGFGYLAAMAAAHMRWGLPKTQSADFNRYAVAALGYGVVLAIFVYPLIVAKGQIPHDFHVGAEGFDAGRAGWMVVHNATQLFYLTGAAGAALMVFCAFRPTGRVRLGLLFIVVVALFCVPPMRVYNHYESVIIDQIDVVLICVTILVSSLLWTAGPGATPVRRALVLAALFLPAVLTVAPMLAVQSRPDVSARLYAPVVPILIGLCWAGAATLSSADPSRAVFPRIEKILTRVLTVCFALFFLFGALNTIGSFRARMDIEQNAKQKLADLLKKPGAMCPFVVALNRDHELAVEELEAFGVTWSECSELFVPNRVHLDPADEDLSNWQIQGHRYSLRPPDHEGMRDALLAGRAPKRCSYLYLQSPKSMMETQDFERFAGNFDWAFGNLPEFDHETHEQQVEIQFRERTGYQKLFERAGGEEFLRESMFDLFPLNPSEIITRILNDIPVIESYAYEGRILFLDKCITR
jgi:hypothetical protein